MSQRIKNQKVQSFSSVDEVFEALAPGSPSIKEEQTTAKQQSLGVEMASRLLREFEKGVIKSQRAKAN